jgi:hypothetical protein
MPKKFICFQTFNVSRAAAIQMMTPITRRAVCNAFRGFIETTLTFVY